MHIKLVTKLYKNNNSNITEIFNKEPKKIKEEET